MLKAVIFDLDGTLVDSAGDILVALNRLLDEMGLARVTLAEVKAMVGDGATKLVERALTARGGDLADLARASQRFLSHYEGQATLNTAPYPGVRETLASLAGEGLALAVVTNKPHAATMEILDALGFTKLFAAVIGGDSLARRKPDPDPVRAALARIGVAPSAALMVGDNYHDIEAAHAAGVRAVAVSWGYSHRPPEDLGADWLIHAMPDLSPIVAALRTGR